MPEFSGFPEEWFDDPHWRCPNGHVSTMYVKSSERGAICPACGESVKPTHPNDVDDQPESIDEAHERAEFMQKVSKARRC